MLTREDLQCLMWSSQSGVRFDVGASGSVFIITPSLTIRQWSLVSFGFLEVLGLVEHHVKKSLNYLMKMGSMNKT